MTDPYRPVPERPPEKSDWKVGDYVRVQYRPTTGTLLEALEGESGMVMEVVDLDTDQCIRVRFPVEVWHQVPEKVRRHVDLVHRAIGKLRSYPWPLRRKSQRDSLAAEAWIFGGDLQ